MQRRVCFVTLDILPNVAPLVSGYLEAYACLDPVIKSSWQFEQYVNIAKTTPVETLVDDLRQIDADVYGFSCYSWNMGLIKNCIKSLLSDNPGLHIILGGAQVLNQGPKYLDPAYENLVICNGEGEKTFYHYLKTITERSVDLSAVKGLSFYRNGALTTTEPEPRIKNLDEIPSPMLNGMYDTDRYSNIFIETNRGCPFSCHFCYWGGAIGAKVNKFSEERIQAEFEWSSKNKFESMVILDANWGILKRDVDLSRFLADCKKKYGFPYILGFSASKNTAERVARIAKILNDTGLLLNHTISLQTMEQQVLKKVGRKNIKTSQYIDVQNYLNDSGISSHIELIWPLPGETLKTLSKGINNLCQLGAEMFFFHPLCLTNNLELNNRIEEYGLVSEKNSDSASESELVIQTKEVSAEDYYEGWRFMFVVIIMHNLLTAKCLCRYLAQSNLTTYGDFFWKFVNFLKQNPALELSRIIEEVALSKEIDAFTLGRIAYYTNSNRNDFDSLLYEFASAQDWWEDDMARLLFEIDLLNRPFFYKPDLEVIEYTFKEVTILQASQGKFLVQIPVHGISQVKSLLGKKAVFEKNMIKVNHQFYQPSHRPSLDKETYWLHCYHNAFSIAKIVPKWEDSYASLIILN